MFQSFCHPKLRSEIGKDATLRPGPLRAQACQLCIEQIQRQRKTSSAALSRVSSSILSHARAAKSAETQQQPFLYAYHLTASVDSLFARGSCGLATWGSAKMSAPGVEAGA